MAAKKQHKKKSLSPLQLAKRRHEALELHLEGHTNIVIAEKLGVSEGTIRRDLRLVKDEWGERNDAAISAMRLEEDAKIRKLEVEYWAVYHESDKPLHKITAKRTIPVPDTSDFNEVSEIERLLNEAQARADGMDLTPDERAELIVAEITTVMQEHHPDIRCLDGIRNCIKDRCVLWGLPIPMPKDDRTDDDDDDGGGAEDVAHEVMEILKQGIQPQAEIQDA